MPNHDLTTLDLVCVLMDTELRPLDFALLLEFERKISPVHATGTRRRRARLSTAGGFGLERRPADPRFEPFPGKEKRTTSTLFCGVG